MRVGELFEDEWTKAFLEEQCRQHYIPEVFSFLAEIGPIVGRLREEGNAVFNSYSPEDLYELVWEKYIQDDSPYQLNVSAQLADSFEPGLHTLSVQIEQDYRTTCQQYLEKVYCCVAEQLRQNVLSCDLHHSFHEFLLNSNRYLLHLLERVLPSRRIETVRVSLLKRGVTTLSELFHWDPDLLGKKLKKQYSRVPHQIREVFQQEWEKYSSSFRRR